MHVLEFSQIERLAACSEVDFLSAGHPARTDGSCEQQYGLSSIAQGRGRQRFEGATLQGIAGEERGRLAKCDVTGRLAAAKHVVIHARQVVMNERISMDQLDCGSHAVDDCRVCTSELARGVGEQRAYALAAAQHAIAHRLVQALRRLGHWRQEAVDDAFDSPRALARPDGPGDIRMHRVCPCWTDRKSWSRRLVLRAQKP